MKLAQELIILSELMKEDLSLKDLMFMRSSIQTNILINPKESVRLTSLLKKTEKLINYQRHLQSEKKVPLAKKYLSTKTT